MKKRTEFILVLLILLITLLPFFFIFYNEFSYLFEDINLNPNDYARITDVEYKAVLVDEPDSEGKVVITERLTFDIHAASKYNLFWELWRDLPEEEIDGVKVHYKVNSVKQILDDGTEIIYAKSPKLYWDDYDYVSTNRVYGPEKWYHSQGPYNESNQKYECVFFYVDGLYREEVVFEIEYEMYNAALRYRDCSDLYLSLYSEETIKYLESFKAQILIPDKDMPADGNYFFSTYGTNSNSFPVFESDTINPGYHTFSFELNEQQLKFKPYNQYIEFDLVAYGEDKHIFTEYAPSNDYSYDLVLPEIFEEQIAYTAAPKNYKIAKFIVLICSLIGSIFIILYYFTSGSRMKSKFVFYKPTMKINYFREIPSDLDPNFAAAFVCCKHKAPKDDPAIYSAILLSLARKKYIELAPLKFNDMLITITTAPTHEPLTLCEEYYFNLLIRHSNGYPIPMSQFQQRVSNDYENTGAFARNIKNSIVNIGIKEGYFQKADYAQPKKSMRSSAKTLTIIGAILIILLNIISYQTRLDLAFGAFFILGISCIISAIYLRTQASKYVLLTQFGEDEYAKWRGLYNFLNSDTLIHERTVIELPLWEKYLVYATAFGLSEKVINAINLRCPQVASSPILNNGYYRSSSFRYSGHFFHSAVRSGSFSAHSGGGGFGYGGGGRGGGGGGGGH